MHVGESGQGPVIIRLPDLLLLVLLEISPFTPHRIDLGLERRIGVSGPN